MQATGPFAMYAPDFATEALDAIAAAEHALLALEAPGDDDERLATVLRALHTVKGIAGMLGLGAVAELCHAAEETASTARRSGHVSPEARAALEACCDLLDDLILEPPADAVIEQRRIDALHHRLAAPTTTGGEPGASAAPPSVTPAVHGADARRPGARTCRVDAMRLDALEQLTSAFDCAVSEHESLRSLRPSAPTIARQLHASVRELRSSTLQPVMRHLAALVEKLARDRSLSIRFDADGAALTLDRSVAERLAGVLAQLVRNACAHGIESAADRAAAGKPPIGRIAIAVTRGDGLLHISVTDDGRGFDRARIAACAAGLGLTDGRAVDDDAVLWRLLSRSGFTTETNPALAAGRGLGLDVVREAVEAMGGMIRVRSIEGVGAAVLLDLPDDTHRP
jgi:two-component system chemotaxis sensor kinase CheA